MTNNKMLRMNREKKAIFILSLLPLTALINKKSVNNWLKIEYMLSRDYFYIQTQNFKN